MHFLDSQPDGHQGPIYSQFRPPFLLRFFLGMGSLDFSEFWYVVKEVVGGSQIFEEKQNYDLKAGKI